MKQLWLIWAAVALAAIQMIVAFVVTRRYREYFDGRPAGEYGQAIAALGKDRPKAALVIRACYALLLVELLVVWLW